MGEGDHRPEDQGRHRGEESQGNTPRKEEGGRHPDRHYRNTPYERQIVEIHHQGPQNPEDNAHAQERGGRSPHSEEVRKGGVRMTRIQKGRVKKTPQKVIKNDADRNRSVSDHTFHYCSFFLLFKCLQMILFN